jgi:hypothetical protein
VRPYDEEIAIGVQHGLTDLIAADFQFTHHWFGNFIAAQNTATPPADYDTFCVTAPSSQNGFSLPNGGAQTCGFANLQPAYSLVVPFSKVQSAKTFGDVSDVYTGFDLGVTARLPRGGTASGGFGIGHEVLDICAVAGQVNVSYAAVAGVLASSSGTLLPFGSVAGAGATATPSTLYCHVQPPFQPNIKGLFAYPLPWWGLRASMTLQNLTGPQILANYAINATNVATNTTLGRAVTGGAATAPLIQPGTLYGDRITQVDGRFSKGFKAGSTRIQTYVDIFNLLNGSGILTLNNTYGAAWRTPTLILQGRLVKLGVQVDF